MTKKLALFVLVLFAFGMVACGTEDEKQDAQKSAMVWGAANSAAGQAAGEAMSQLQTAKKAAESESFNFEMTGTSGGKITVTGNGTFDSDGNSFDISLKMKFEGYNSQGMVLDGEISYHFVGNDAAFTGEYSGILDYEGDEFKFNITYRYTADPISISIEGTVGGNKISGGYSA